MFLSIIIPHYNLAQALLKRCLDSILAIGLPADDYEIIVVDDGSDNPPRWVKEIDTANIKLIESEHNCQGAARNTGIDAAQGEYIQFIDADDTLQQNSAIPQCIEKLKQERPDILRFGYRVCSKETKNSKRTKKIKFSNTISGALFMEHNNLPANVWCYFVKTELLKKKSIRFTTGIYHEDEEFSTILHFYAKTLITSNAPIYNYCIRENSTITGKTAEMVEKKLNDRMSVIEKLATFKAATNDQSNSIQKKALQRKLTTLAVDAIINFIRSGKSIKQIQKQCIERIKQHRLYPIAKEKYGYKFSIFRILANSNTGLHILRIIIPQTSKPAKK